MGKEKEVRMRRIEGSIEISLVDEKGGVARVVVGRDEGSRIISHILNHLDLNRVPYIREDRPNIIGDDARRLFNKTPQDLKEFSRLLDSALVSLRRYGFLLKRCFPIKDVFEIQELWRLAESVNGCIFEPGQMMLVADNLEEYLEYDSEDEWSDDDRVLVEKVYRLNEYERLHLLDSLERMMKAPSFEEAAYELEVLSKPKEEPMPPLLSP